jgi:hypothetical protein
MDVATPGFVLVGVDTAGSAAAARRGRNTVRSTAMSRMRDMISPPLDKSAERDG